MEPLLSSARPLTAAPVHPMRQPSVHITVALMELPVGVPRPEIVAPTSKNGIQCRNDLLHVLPAVPRVGQLMHAFPDSLLRLGRRPPLHKVRPRVPLDAPFLANRAAQKLKAFLPTSQVHHPRLLGMQFQPKPVHHQPDSP